MEYKEFATEDVKLVMSRIAEVLNLSDSEEEIIKPPSYTARESKTPLKTYTVLTTSSVEFKNLLKEDDRVSTPRKVSKKEFEEKFITRSAKFLQRKETKIKEKQEQKEKQKVEGATFKPVIDPKSRSMIGSSASIINRLPEILKDKAQKLNTAKEKRKKEIDEEEKKELTLRPQVNNKKKKYPTTEMFLKHIDEWQDNLKRDKKLKAEKREKELSASLTFKPKICRRSRSLVGDRKNIYERSIETLERQRSRKPPQYSFTPSINKKSSDLVSESGKSVFERLAPTVRTFSPVPTSRNRDRLSLGSPSLKSGLNSATPDMRASLTPRPRNSDFQVSPKKPPALPKPKPISRAATPKLANVSTPKSVHESPDTDILAELGLLSTETVKL